MHFGNTLFKIDNNFTLIVLTIIVPAFDLGTSFGKVKSGKILEIYFQTCVGTLFLDPYENFI